MTWNNQEHQGQPRTVGRAPARLRVTSLTHNAETRNSRGSVFQWMSLERIPVSERLGKNHGKARVGWERPQPSQVESSHREQHQGEKDRRSASSSSYSMQYTTARWSAAGEDTPLALIFDGRRHATRKAINKGNLEFTEGDLKTISVPCPKIP
ncbi:unnamed protein product [Cuscuta campestris]|uniref:Uncharacterized protein n=1 Tax=Cuscuta campestris TaxID=132261 RepID=A0A484MNS7_9ASTE|nr:unnamed protein product [Cuscuta campestris]